MNDPMPWQLTVGQLREALRDAPDEAVVGLRVPPPGLGDAEITTLYNLRVEYRGSVTVMFVPVAGPPGQA